MRELRILAVFAFAALLFGCSSPKVKIVGDELDPAKPTILIALLRNSQTQFKADLVNMIRQDFAGTYNVAVREVSKPEDLKGLDYDALVVMETLKAWLLFNRGLKKFADLPDQSRTVYFVSSGDSDWTWNGRQDLKIVTGATGGRRAAETYPELRAFLDEVLKR